MTIRNITPEDLPVLSSLLEDSNLTLRSDICLGHSKIMFDDSGDVVCAVLLKREPLSEYFNGSIPPDLYEDKNIEDYEEGDEYLIKEAAETIFPKGMQYEIIGFYTSCNCRKEDVNNLFSNAQVDDGGFPIGIIWIPCSEYNPVQHVFYNFNNTVWVDIPRTD